MYDICILYGRVFMVMLPAFLLQYAFQSLLITAERPRLGLAFTVATGVSNMILDWLFVGVFAGAWLAQQLQPVPDNVSGE